MIRRRYLIVVAILCIENLGAQSNSAAETAVAKYKAMISALEEQKTAQVNQANAAFEEGVSQAKQQLKQIFDRLIQDAALRKKTEEVQALALQLQSHMNPEEETAAGTADTHLTQDVNGKMSLDTAELIGKWSTSGKGEGRPTYVFEFRSGRRVLVTQHIRSSNGEHQHSQEYVMRRQGETLELNLKNPTRMAAGHKSWYEIKLPFDVADLEIIRHSESPNSKSSQTFSLTKQM